MSEMVERVARALSAEIDEGLPRFTAQRWEDLSWPAKTALLKRARTVIAAMREPTEAMHLAADALPISYDDGHDTDEVWRTMVDAALTPAPPEQ